MSVSGRCVLGRCVVRLDSGVLPTAGDEQSERAALEDRLLQGIPRLEVLLDELEASGHVFESPRAPHFHARCAAVEHALLVERLHLEVLAEPPLDPAQLSRLGQTLGEAVARTVARTAPRLPPPPEPPRRPWWRRW